MFFRVYSVDIQGLCMFGEHDYQITYGRRAGLLNRSTEVNIRAVRACAPTVGDTYTFGGENGLCDAIVSEVTRIAGGAWSARCRMVDGSPV